jgi:spermidine synthase
VARCRLARGPEVNFSDHGDIRYLHLGTEWVQGSMKLDAPFEIELEYVQRMMAWLLFVDAARPWPAAMRCSSGWARRR